MRQWNGGIGERGIGGGGVEEIKQSVGYCDQ